MIPLEHQPSFTRLAVLAAALAIVFGALYFASSIVTQIMLALVLTCVFWPLYAWLRGRGLGALVALLLIFVVLCVVLVLLGLLVGYSVSGLASGLSQYAERFTAELRSLDAWFQSLGLTTDQLASGASTEAFSGLFAALARGLVNALQQIVVISLLLMFFLAEGAAIVNRLRSSLDPGDPTPARLAQYARDVGQYFVLRAGVNAVTGAGVAIVLWLLGVDFPLLWGVLTFFLSFIPYIGMFLASVPSVLLAWAEFDIARAVLVAIALTVVNATAENLVQPALMHKGLDLSPTFVFLSVFFWTWLLGASGSFLALPLSLGLLAILGNFPSARWFVGTVMTRPAGHDSS